MRQAFNEILHRASSAAAAHEGSIRAAVQHECHSAVAVCACMCVRHVPACDWARPLPPCLQSPTRDQLLEYLEGKIARCEWTTVAAGNPQPALCQAAAAAERLIGAHRLANPGATSCCNSHPLASHTPDGLCLFPNPFYACLCSVGWMPDDVVFVKGKTCTPRVTFMPCLWPCSCSRRRWAAGLLNTTPHIARPKPASARQPAADIVANQQAYCCQPFCNPCPQLLSEIPHTATGKISKLTLRKQLSGHRPARSRL